jgi:hypothetical protein
MLPGDNAGIICSPSGLSLQGVESQLTQQYVVPKSSWWMMRKGRCPGMSIARCSGIFRLKSPGKRHRSTPNGGRAVQSASEAGIPMSFLGNDAKLPGDTVVTGTESHAYASYYGMLSLQPGLGLNQRFGRDDDRPDYHHLPGLAAPVYRGTDSGRVEGLKVATATWVKQKDSPLSR